MEYPPPGSIFEDKDIMAEGDHEISKRENNNITSYPDSPSDVREDTDNRNKQTCTINPRFKFLWSSSLLKKNLHF